MSSDNPYAAPSFSAESPYSPFQMGDGEIKNVKAEIGDIFNYALKVWKENLGILIGASLIIFSLAFGLAFFQSFVESMLKGIDQRPTAASSTFVLIFSILSNVVQVFVAIGNVQLMLALLRGQPANVGMLFGGGGRLLPTIGVSLLLGLAIGVGFLLLIIPGIIVILFYWPSYYLVVDRRTSVMQAFTVARSITKGNELTTFVMGLVSFAICFVGVLALCVGIIAAQPLAMLMIACAYLMMSGQIDTRAGQTM